MCPPDVLSSLLTALGGKLPSRSQQVPSKANNEGKKRASKARKSSNAGGKTSTSGGTRGAARGPRDKKKNSSPSQPLSSAVALRRTLRKSAVRSLTRLQREEKSINWSEGSGGIANMRCAVIKGVTRDDVRKSVDKLTDRQIESRDRSLPSLVYLGFIPRDSLEAQLLAARKEERSPVKASGASTVEKPKEKSKSTSPQPAKVPPSVPVGSIVVQPKSVPDMRVAIRQVRPLAMPDSARTPRDRLPFAFKGIELEPVPGQPEIPGFDDDDLLFSDYLSWVRNGSSGQLTRLVESSSGASVALVEKLKKIPLCFFGISSTTPPLARYVIFLNTTSPVTPGIILKKCPWGKGFSISPTLFGIFPYVSPKMSERSAPSTSRRPSVSSTGGPSRVQGPQASSDVFADLYSLSSGK